VWPTTFYTRAHNIHMQAIKNFGSSTRDLLPTYPPPPPGFTPLGDRNSGL